MPEHLLEEEPPELSIPAEIGHDQATRFQLASAGASALRPLVECWNATPSLRHGVVVTLGMMLWYVDSTRRPLAVIDRIEARRYLLRCAVAEEAWLKQAFVEAAEWTHDPTYLPLLRRIAGAEGTIGKLEEELSRMLGSDVIQMLSEQWDAMHAEGWVSDHGLSRSGHCSFVTANIALGEREPRTARVALTALRSNLSAARGRGVREEAYELIKAGVEAADERLKHI